MEHTYIKYKTAVFAVLLAAILFFMAGCSAVVDNKVLQAENKLEAAEDIWGIEIIGIRRTAAGNLLDFRYKITEPERVLPLLKRQVRPYLIEQVSQAKLGIPNLPKVGRLRSGSNPSINQTYYMLFTNPNGFVKAGDKVSVVMGDFRAENIIVQ